VRRAILATIVGLLSFSASGVSTLVIDEPCIGYELPGSDEGVCAPTCLTCGCCAQAAEPVVVIAATSPEIPVADITAFLPYLPRTAPHDILHVPKPALI